MTRPILLSVSTYCCIALFDTSFYALQPLFYSTPIELGGLGFDTRKIGSTLSILAIMNGTIQLIFFPTYVRRFGPKRVIVVGIALFVRAYTNLHVFEKEKPTNRASQQYLACFPLSTSSLDYGDLPRWSGHFSYSKCCS